jgi:hypothetical protein
LGVSGESVVSFEPFDWNVVVVGRWNQAILTPAGIAKHVFKLASHQMLPVKVPLDGLMPYLVGDPEERVEVAVEANRLLIQLRKLEYGVLGTAMNMGANVLESLPHTPVTAAGFNIKFRQKEADQERGYLTSHSEIDDGLSDAGFTISRRTLSRGLTYESGLLNVDITTDSKGMQVAFNFHLASNDCTDLVQWLHLSTENVKSSVSRIMDFLRLDIGEVNHDDNAVT